MIGKQVPRSSVATMAKRRPQGVKDARDGESAPRPGTNQLYAHARKEEAMKYILLIHQGDAPTPYDPDAWERLSEEERNAVFADYKAINETPGAPPGLPLGGRAAAPTRRAGGGRTPTRRGAVVACKEPMAA